MSAPRGADVRIERLRPKFTIVQNDAPPAAPDREDPENRGGTRARVRLEPGRLARTVACRDDENPLVGAGQVGF
jgi:hypothetical protein